MIENNKAKDILDTVKTENNKLIELAYDKYLDELNVNCLYIFESSKEMYGKDWKDKIDSILLDQISDSLKSLDENNPLKYDKIVCYKLFLCSYLNPFWEFKYPNLYKYFSYKLKQDNTLTIDIFIGKLITLFNTNNDAIYYFIHSLVNNKYGNTTIEKIMKK